MRGAELCGRFYRDVVRPIVLRAAGTTPHGAALLGEGSEVLGYDDAVSTDHGFGPRLRVFLPDGAADAARAVSAVLERELPESFAGFPVRFAALDGQPARHQVLVTTVGSFLRETLGVQPLAGLSTVDWLTVPSQRLASVVGGTVYADGTGEIGAARRALAWYPPDVWRYLLAAGWLRISQDEAFVGRAGGTGDELGSAVLAGRLARDQMRLAFLLERRYAPYPKWFGRAFGELGLAGEIGPWLTRALRARDWRDRQDALCEAGEALARATNALRLCPPQQPSRRRYYQRDIDVLGGERFVAALLESVRTPEVAVLGARLVGGIDQVVDSTDVLTAPDRCQAIRPLWTEDLASPFAEESGAETAPAHRATGTSF